MNFPTWIKNLSTTPYPLLLILLLAFFLRVNGLAFGLPAVYHDDEHQYVEAGVAFLQGWEPARAELEQLNNPPLFKTVLGLFYLAVAWPAAANLPDIVTAENWRVFFHYAGRWASAASGVLAVAMLFALGRRLYDRAEGLLAALFLAVAFLPVRESHFAVNDAPLTLLALIALYFCAGILHTGRRFHYVAAGVSIGLAVATKYTGAYLLSVLLLAHLFFHARQRSGRRVAMLAPRLGLGLVAIPLTFAVAAPVAVLSWQQVLQDLGQLSEYGQAGYHNLRLAPYGGWLFYLTTLGWGVGWPLLLLLGAATILALLRRSAEDVLLLTFPLLLYLLMGAQQMVFVRFMLPALPPLLLLGAAWLFRLDGLAQRRLLLPRHLVAAAASILLLLQPLAMSLWLGVVLSQVDTRAQAENWLRDHLPPGSVIYVERHAVPRYDVSGRVSLPFIQEKDFPFEGDNHLARLQERGVQFVIASDFHNRRTFTDPVTEAGRQSWLAQLSRRTPIQEFQPYRWPGDWFVFDQRYGPWFETILRQQPGPVVRVYALDADEPWLNPLDAANQITDRAAVFGLHLSEVSADGSLTADIYWLHGDTPQPEAEWRVALEDLAGLEVTQTVATPLLQPAPDESKLFKNRATLQLPPGTPPGRYQLRLSLLDPATDVASGSIAPDQAAFTLATPIPSDDSAPAPSAANLAPGLDLLAVELDESLLSGQNNRLVLLWQATDPVAIDYTVQINLLDKAGSVVDRWQGQPVHGHYPTSQWPAGAWVRDSWSLPLPDDLPSGEEYHLAVALFNSDVAAGDTLLGPVTVQRATPQLPPMQHTSDAIFGDNLIKLAGFNVRAIPDSSNSGVLELDLFWQSLAPTTANYRVSISLVDAEGQVALAHQAEPAGGAAPTTGWQPGDIVHDFHAIPYRDLSLDRQYRLELSLIQPDSGNPLPAIAAGSTGPSLPLLLWP